MAETHRRTRRLDMPASADKQALADELSHKPRLRPGPHCHPRREPVPANMPAYDYLRNPPLGCARVPTCIQFEEGRCVVLDSCGGRARRREEQDQDAEEAGAPAQPRDLPLVHYKMNISTTFRPIGMYTV